MVKIDQMTKEKVEIRRKGKYIFYYSSWFCKENYHDYLTLNKLKLSCGNEPGIEHVAKLSVNIIKML